MKQITSLLEKLVKNPELHSRFVNTLSFLEYTGARKILKSQLEQDISQELLSHAAEEIRHAQIFKKIALEISSGKRNSYHEDHLLCRKEASHYIQFVDHEIERKLGKGKTWLNYLYTTLLIEERVNIFYPIYASFLEKFKEHHSFAKMIRSVLKEEESHLYHVLKQLQIDGKSSRHFTEEAFIELHEKEENAFIQWMNTLMKQIDNQK